MTSRTLSKQHLPLLFVNYTAGLAGAALADPPGKPLTAPPVAVPIEPPTKGTPFKEPPVLPVPPCESVCLADKPAVCA